VPQQAKRNLRAVPKALYFNGVNNYVSIASSDSLKLNASFTIIGWLRFPPGVAGSRGIVQKNPKAADYDYMLYLASLGYPGMYFKNPTGTVYYVDEAVDRRDNAWHMWAGAFDGRYLSLYIDASLKGTTDTGGTTVRTSDTPLSIFYGWGGYAKGYASSVLIYSRALSQDEILWNYNYPDNPVWNGLVLWLHWGSIDVANGKWWDKSGNGNHGTIYGATLAQLQLPSRQTLSPFRILSLVR